MIVRREQSHRISGSTLDDIIQNIKRFIGDRQDRFFRQVNIYPHGAAGDDGMPGTFEAHLVFTSNDEVEPPPEQMPLC